MSHSCSGFCVHVYVAGTGSSGAAGFAIAGTGDMWHLAFPNDTERSRVGEGTGCT